jgi:YbbR domain-containing protein
MARVPTSLVRNWQLKLSALGLSIFLWALVQTEPLSQETFSSVPVIVEVDDTAWTAVGAPTPATVELRLGGPAREIIRLAREGTSVRVPISAVGTRDTVIALQRDWVQLGQRAGVTVESLSPGTVRVSFEPAMTRTVPVAMRTRGELPADLALSSPLEVNPAVVTLRGPESRLAGLDSVTLEPLDLGRVRDSDILTLPVDTTGLGGAVVEPPEAMVGVRVEPVLERDVPRDVILAERERGVSLTAVPSSIHLRLSGARTLLLAMDASLVRVSVPADAVVGLEPGEERLVRLQIDGVPPLVNASLSTEVVTVRRADPSQGPRPRP